MFEAPSASAVIGAPDTRSRFPGRGARRHTPPGSCDPSVLDRPDQVAKLDLIWSVYQISGFLTAESVVGGVEPGVRIGDDRADILHDILVLALLQVVQTNDHSILPRPVRDYAVLDRAMVAYR